MGSHPTSWGSLVSVYVAEKRFVESTLEDGDLEHILLALKNVAEARRNLIDAVNDPDSDWEICYQLLAQGETPTLQAIATLLNKLGLKLSVTVKQEQAA